MAKDNLDNIDEDIDDSLPQEENHTFELKKEESMGIKNFSSIYGDRPGQIDNSELEGVNE